MKKYISYTSKANVEEDQLPRGEDNGFKVWVQLLKTLLKSTLGNSKESAIVLYW